MRDIETFMEMAPVAIWIAHDPECKRITGNRLGYGMLRTAAGQNLSQDAPPEEAPAFTVRRNGKAIANEDLPMQYAASHGVDVRDSEMEIVFPNGGSIHVFGNASPLYDDDGLVRGCVGTFLDITDRKNQEQENAALTARIQRAMAETHHRVKNNLQVISALIELQADAVQVDSAASAVRSLGCHVRALATIHDLLTEQSKAGRGVDTISARDALDRLAPLLQSTAHDRRVRTTISALDIPTRQAGALTLVVNELVTNAIKHGTGDVIVTLAANGETACLTVQDGGAGFPPDFDPVQAANTGLELVLQLVGHDLQGTVRFTNRPECGACVAIEFPLAAA
jgi:two-component system CheB/CheR fusion protein